MNNVALLAIFVILFISCKKENECCTDVPQINPLTNTESLLVGPLWMLAGGSTNVNGMETEWCDVLPECMKDNLANYEANGNIIVTGGLIYCNPDDPEIIETGTWALSNDEDQLLLADFTFNIILLNQAIMNLTLSMENEEDTIFNTYTYMAQ